MMIRHFDCYQFLRTLRDHPQALLSSNIINFHTNTTSIYATSSVNLFCNTPFCISKKACRSFSMLMSAPPLKRWFIHFSSKNLVVLTSTIQAVATWRMSQRNFYIKVASCQGCCVAKCVVFAARFSDVTFGEEGRSKHHPPNLCRVLNAARGCIFREGPFLRKLIRSTQKELHSKMIYKPLCARRI